jgi:hypothetical protein
MIRTTASADDRELNWYGLKKFGYDSTCIPLTGDPAKDQLTIETIAYRIGHKEEEGGLGKFGHMRAGIDLLWNRPESSSMVKFIWNSWANKMLFKACEEKELGVAGPTSAGKCCESTTYVLMYDGTAKMFKDISPGDQVMGDDGTPRTVQEVHSGYGPLLKVTPWDSERDPWRCTPNHTMVFRSVLTGAVEYEDQAHIFAQGPKSVFSELRLFRPSNQILAKIFPTHEYNFHVQSRETFGFTIESDGEGEWVGFSVDGNHRFLLADLTVIHNSSPFALYVVWEYITDPTHCLCLVMSTTIAGAKKRIWKNVREYWESVPNLPGKALWSTNEIRGLNYTADGYGESSGIYLLASEQSNEKAALDKIIGIKSPRTGNSGASYEELIQQPEYADLRRYFDEETLRDLVPRLHNLSQDRIGKLLLVVDEATGMVESILNAVNTNLKPGNVGHFQIILLGNPNLPYDPFGQFCKPKAGWDGVDLLNDEEWRTETGGLCIRFNGERNPRILEGNDRYSWMLRLEDIKGMEEKYGRDSLFYHRMVLGTWCLNGGETGIYSPADIELSGSKRTSVTWRDTAPTPVSFLDPAFTAGGDRALATFGLVGTDMDGDRVFLLTDKVAIKVDVNNAKIPVNYQIVHGWKKECQARKVLPQHAAYDRTGGGIPFGDIVFTQWSPLVTGIVSGGSASKSPLSGEYKPGTREPVLACDRFSNRATEIWYAAQPLFRSGQIFGVDDELAKELCSRQHSKNGGTKLQVEQKKVYRDREGKSPDESDSFLGLIDFCRTKFKLIPTEKTKALAEQPMSNTARAAWNAFKERARRLSNRKNLKRG